MFQFFTATVQHQKLITLAGISHAQPKSPLKVETMAKTIAEALFEQGMEKGMEMAMEKGMEIGRLLAARKMLQRLLLRRFGTLPEPVVNRIESMTDLERLRSCIEQTIELRAIDELAL